MRLILCKIQCPILWWSTSSKLYDSPVPSANSGGEFNQIFKAKKKKRGYSRLSCLPGKHPRRGVTTISGLSRLSPLAHARVAVTQFAKRTLSRPFFLGSLSELSPSQREATSFFCSFFLGPRFLVPFHPVARRGQFPVLPGEASPLNPSAQASCLSPVV